MEGNEHNFHNHFFPLKDIKRKIENEEKSNSQTFYKKRKASPFIPRNKKDEEKFNNKKEPTKKRKSFNSKEKMSLREEFADILVEPKQKNNDFLNLKSIKNQLEQISKSKEEETLSNNALIQENINLDNLLKKLLNAKYLKSNTPIDINEKEIKYVIFKSKNIIENQPVFLELNGPMNVCGDTHGQFYDLLRLFDYGEFPPNNNYLFLGDYVDRGKNSIETIILLLIYKIKYPENFFMLRGNHESDNINKVYGFYDECKRRYNIKIWKYFNDLFNIFPITAIIKDRILCMHGGLSPELYDLEQLKNIVRPTEIPNSGLLCDLLWSDPDDQLDQDQEKWGENERGISYTFNSKIVENFNYKFELDCICRAHQVVENGYEFFSNRQLVTIFSAPNYCGEFDNAGALLMINENLECNFKILKPVNIINMNKVGMRPSTPPKY